MRSGGRTAPTQPPALRPPRSCSRFRRPTSQRQALMFAAPLNRHAQRPQLQAYLSTAGESLCQHAWAGHRYDSHRPAVVLGSPPGAAACSMPVIACDSCAGEGAWQGSVWQRVARTLAGRGCGCEGAAPHVRRQIQCRDVQGAPIAMPRHLLVSLQPEPTTTMPLALCLRMQARHAVVGC